MNRVKINDVLDAYKNLNVIPERESWATCGLGILVRQKEGRDPEDDSDAAEVLGLTTEYCSGFVLGFDNGEKSSVSSDEWNAGYEDGRFIARTVIYKDESDDLVLHSSHVPEDESNDEPQG